ncbi:MAG: hypothetical protein AAB276_04945 [Pseudomonadota bacterium]
MDHDIWMGTIYRRLEYVLILTLFLPVIFGALFKDKIQELGDVTLGLGIVIAVLILNFLLLEILPNKMHCLTERVLKAFLFLNILAFVPVLLIVATYETVIAFPVTLIMQTSLVSLYLLPIGMFCVLMIELIRQRYARSGVFQ